MAKSLIEIRKHLHQNPELSHQEYETSVFIEELMLELQPDQVLRIGEFSRAYVFDSKKEGEVLVFRADIDALPIEELNDFPHRSKKKQVSHLCGHDGHSSILIGLARKIASHRPQKGKLVLLFQSAEETGLGAKEVVNHAKFQALKPDYIFGLHNIPSYPLHQILIREGVFASASKGVILKLVGRTSHAAEPEKGINPALAIAEITRQLHQLNHQKGIFSSLTLLSFIYTRMGEQAFGTSAGEAEMGFTLRSYTTEDMKKLCLKMEEVIEEVCRKESLGFHMDFVEEFPITLNHEEGVSEIGKAAQSLNLSVKYLEEPMKWSEDFGYYQSIAKTGFFGIGAGKNQPNLHDPSYDFPDVLIETGIQMFYKIYQNSKISKF